MEDFICSICDIRCSGIEPYMQHMSSNKHKKKEEQRKLLETTDRPEKSFYCNTCGIFCSGIVPFQQHMGSDKHLKKEEAKQLSECSISSSKVDEQEENYTTLPAQNNFICVACDKQFTGFVPYEQHMNSIVHKKKLLKIDLQLALESEKNGIPKNEVPVEEQLTSSTSLSDAVNLKENSTLGTLFRCNLCEKGFLSQDMRDLHLLSSACKTEKKAFLYEDGYFCKVCNKKFTGSIPYGQHMGSSVHQKNVKKIELYINMSSEKISGAGTCLDGVKDIVQSAMAKSTENSSFGTSALHELHKIGSTEESNLVLAECYVCRMKFYSNEEIKGHYESESHYDNQNIFEYKRKVKVFAPEEPFNLSA